MKIKFSFSFFKRSKYFRGRRLHGGEYDVKVEQAEFKELSVAATVDGGVLASVKTPGNKVVRTFKPDFTLIRQNVRDAPHEDYKNILLGFQYGNVPSVNSLESIYNFQASLYLHKILPNHGNNEIKGLDGEFILVIGLCST